MNKKTFSIEERFDALRETATGRGTQKDKLTRLTPVSQKLSPQTLRQWYLSNGFIQTVVNAPADDAVREWITIKTNRDVDDPKTGLQGLGISRLIENRMEELGVREKIRELIRYSRMYQEGGFLYIGVIADTVQNYNELSLPMPDAIEYIDYVNVFGPDYVSIVDNATNPLSKFYHTKKYYIAGVEVHPTRLWHLVRYYMHEERRGISVIETILDSALAQDTALWSVATLVYEMCVWIFKSPDFKGMTPQKLAETLFNVRSVLSTQSCIGIADDEEFTRIVGTDAGKGFLKEAFDFIMDNLAGMAQMPKSRLMGQAQGTITSGQYDLRAYYESVARFCENEIRPILNWIISLIIKERRGDIYKVLQGNIDSLDWEFEFNPLWIEDTKEQADRELREAQRDQIYITTQVLSPSEVRMMRFKDLEEFDSWQESPVDFSAVSTAPEAEEKEAV